ncbi:MAG: M56 family metallopeptidase [Bacteroidota bacterium]
MDSINWLATVPYGQALGWTLLHSVWQFTLISLAARLMLVLIPRTLPNMRYMVLLASLGAGVLWSVSTWTVEYEIAKHRSTHLDSGLNEQELAVNPDGQTGNLATGEEVFHASDVNESASWLPMFDRAMITAKLGPYLPIISFGWYIGVFIMSIYTLVGFFYLYKLKTRDILLPDAKWKALFEEFTAKMGVFKEVEFLLTEKLQEPVTFYLLRPVVLVPLSVCTGMNPKQVEVLVLHELAHIRRNDFWVNLVQSVIEILYFFHPAVWWISGKIREEREHGCDDMVLKVQKDPMIYAEALTKLKVSFRSPKTRLAMAAKSKHSAFSQRIFRLFGQYDQKSQFLKGSLIALLLLMGLVFQAFYMPGHSIEVHHRHTNETAFSPFSGGEPESVPASEAAPVVIERPSHVAEAIPVPTPAPAAEAAAVPISDEEPTIDMLVDAIHNGMTSVAKFIIEQGVDVNQIGHEGYTPLTEAAHHDELEIVAFLLDNGADINMLDGGSRPAILVAAKNCATEVGKLLLDKGADVDATDAKGHTALMYAAHQGNYTLTKYLLEKGANAELASEDGDTALSTAMRHGHEEVAMLLLGNDQGSGNKPRKRSKRSRDRDYGDREDEGRTPRERVIENSKPIGKLPEGITGSLDVSADGTHAVSFSQIDSKMEVNLKVENMEGETITTVFSGSLSRGTNTLSWSMSKYPYRTYWMILVVEGQELRQKIGRNTTSDWRNLSTYRKD